MASDQSVLLTVLLHHDQSKTLEEIMEPGALRNVNRFMEQKAWGAFRYEVFPSYDFAPIAAQLKKDHA